jgi:hypothetical protein
MFCKAKYCRFSHKHTTSVHQCGRCNEYGHGQMECNSQLMKEALLQYHSDTLPLDKQCTFIDCNNKHNHTSDSHICSKCMRRHFEDSCLIQPFNPNPLFGSFYDSIDIDRFRDNYNNHYIVFYVGMGCTMYVRNINYNLTELYMHSDNWGQYGPDIDDTPVRDIFISGLTEINVSEFFFHNNIYTTSVEDNSVTNSTQSESIQNESIQGNFNCPLCRTEGDKSNVLEVKGGDTSCKICLEETATIYFPNCKHNCCCNECFKHI